ncbi:MAG: amidase, partial [Burkholderiales bacterium]|nr:amidase [Burkholderiales bacterium]
MAMQVNPESIAAGAISAADALAQARSAAAGSAGRHVFLRRFDAQADAAAQAVDAARKTGTPLPALAGLPVSVKDLFDVAGHPTTGAAKVLADALP